MRPIANMAAVFLVGVTAWPAAAQNAPSTPPIDQPPVAEEGIQEIVVTAQRRGENLQDVPIAVTALTSSQLEAVGITNTADIMFLTPGLQFQQSIGLAAPYIRGIGVSGQGVGIEASVATYIDGVYLASGGSSLFSLNNIDRVEVLKGPQGTLFGRNSSGGLIQVITPDPSHKPAADVSLTYDDWKTFTASTYATTGITDKLAADVAIRYSKQGEGWGIDRNTGGDVDKVAHDLALRSKWLFEPGDKTKIVVAADYSDFLGSTFVTFSPIPGHPDSGGYQFAGNPWDSVSSFNDPYRDAKNWGISGDWSQNLGFATLRSISAFRSSLFLAGFDPGSLPTPTVTIFSRVDQKQFSQELQLLSPEASPVKWIGGLYYFHTDSAGSGSRTLLYPLLTFAPGEIDTSELLGHTVNSLAAFGQMTVPVTDSLNIAAGARVTSDRFTYRNTTVTDLTFVPAPFDLSTTVFPDRSARQTRPTWRAAIDYKAANDTLLYASYNRGFKSGGFDITDGNGPVLKPEIVDSFEVGAKVEAFDRTLRFNTAVFYDTVKNLQITVYFNGVNNLRNAASAKAYGIEEEITAIPLPGLTLSATADYLHSRFTNFSGDAPVTTPLPGGGNNVDPNGSATGNQTPRQPAATVTLSANYEKVFDAGKLGLNASWLWSAKWYSDPDDRLYQPAYHLVSSEISWTEPSGHVRFKVFGRNLTNAVVGAQFGSLPNGDVRSLNEPRTYGGGVEIKF